MREVIVLIVSTAICWVLVSVLHDVPDPPVMKALKKKRRRK